MKIDDLTIGEARQLASMFALSTVPVAIVVGPWEIGKNYLIRTVTMIDTGKLVAVGRRSWYWNRRLGSPIRDDSPEPCRPSHSPKSSLSLKGD